jgi:4-diphosphocytidyl-2-C-methyl-D-erythritol kinase
MTFASTRIVRSRATASRTANSRTANARAAVAAAPPRSVVVAAPAKVNLSLAITGRRGDGYHDLDSLMFAISLYDTVAVTASPARRASVSCTVSGPEKVPGGPTNLAARAAVAVMEGLGVTARVRVRLHKVVPFGAGLGGGSSDAAAVIRVLPGLLGRRLKPADAHAIAVGLGADVAFFLSCRPSRATGIGDRLAPLSRVPRGALVLVVPPERVATAWAYRNALPRLTSSRAASRVRRLPRTIDAVETWFFNDFQRGVEKAVPSVRSAREALEALGARAVVMSGSGSAVAAWFDDERGAREAAARYDRPGKVFVAKVIRRAPRPRPVE